MMKLSSAGIVTMKRFVKEKPKELAKKTGLKRKALEIIIAKAESYLLSSP
jgi:hypothetical protein